MSPWNINFQRYQIPDIINSSSPFNCTAVVHCDSKCSIVVIKFSGNFARCNDFIYGLSRTELKAFLWSSHIAMRLFILFFSLLT